MRKYKNKKVELDGKTFDSRLEARRYQELKLLEQAGEIHSLCCQPEFVLQEPFKHGKSKFREIRYIADFLYIEDGRKVVEDVKGMRTDVYMLKKKMFLYRHGDQYDFREVTKEMVK